MYKEFKDKIDSFLSKGIDKKEKYQDILKDIESKISKLENKSDKESLAELKSLKKLKDKTVLMIDSLK